VLGDGHPAADVLSRMRYTSLQTGSFVGVTVAGHFPNKPFSGCMPLATDSPPDKKGTCSRLITPEKLMIGAYLSNLKSWLDLLLMKRIVFHNGGKIFGRIMPI
jgi:hypothetical protein